jgi:hypothetical protein
MPHSAFAYPVTSVTGIPDGWTTADVTFTLSNTGADGGGSVDTFYALGGENPVYYTGPVTVSAEGASSLEFWSHDTHTAREDHNFTTIRIDRSAPVSSIDGLPSGWAPPGIYDFTISAEDVYSGVADTFYRIGTGPVLAYSGVPVPVVAGETTSVEYWSVDAAGNAEAPKTATILVDAGPLPVTLISGIPPGWSSSDVTMTLVANSRDHTVTATYYRIGAGALTPYTSPVRITGEGSRTVTYYSVDDAGGVEAERTATLRIDKTPPVSAVTGIPSGYTPGPVTFQIDSTDAVSGSFEIRYQMDSGPVSTYTGPVSVSAPGAHSLSFFGTDGAGNAEAPKAALILIDRSPPVTTIAGLPSSWSASDVTFTLAATSVHYNVTGTYYRLGAGAFTPYGLPVSITGEGVFGLSYYSTDDRGLVESQKTATVRIDRSPPVSTASGIPGSVSATDVVVTLSASDAVSFVSSLRYRIGDGATSFYSSPIRVSAEGTTTVSYWATDAAGNIEGAHTALVRIHRSTPDTEPPPPSTLPTATLSCPSVWAASFVAKRPFWLSGSLGPVHSQATTLTLQLYRWARAGYVPYATTTVDIPAGVTDYRIRYAVPASGKYALRAYHADATHSASWSAWRYFAVR